MSVEDFVALPLGRGGRPLIRGSVDLFLGWRFLLWLDCSSCREIVDASVDERVVSAFLLEGVIPRRRGFSVGCDV